MKFIQVVGGGLVFVMCSTANAADCSKFTQAFTDQHKMIGELMAQGVADNSAPRATLREMQISNLQSAMQMNLTLMVQSKCPLPSSPIWVSDYMLSAMECMGDKKDCKPRDQWTKLDRNSSKVSTTQPTAKPSPEGPKVHYAPQ